MDIAAKTTFIRKLKSYPRRLASRWKAKTTECQLWYKLNKSQNSALEELSLIEEQASASDIIDAEIPGVVTAGVQYAATRRPAICEEQERELVIQGEPLRQLRKKLIIHRNLREFYLI